MLNFVCTNHVCSRSSLFYCISNKNWTKLMRHCQIQCNFGGIDDLCKLGKRIFNCTDMQIMHFILDKILKLLTYHTPFYHQSLQSYLISKKTVRFFGPPCINYGSSLYHFRDKARSPSDRHTVWWEKNWNGVATRWWKKCDDRFSRFNRIPSCDRQTDGQTSCDGIRTIHSIAL